VDCGLSSQKGTSCSNQNIYPPQGFWRGYPFSISALLDLIYVPFLVLLVYLSHNHRHPVMTLIYVLKQLLDCLDAPVCLNIDVVVEQTEEIWVVRHNPSIVKIVSTDLFFSAIFTPSIN
jgi:hypothetical protein